MNRKPAKRTVVKVWIYVDVQDNGDGTWTAIANLGGTTIGPVTGSSRKDVLSMATDAASVDIDCYYSL